MYLGQGLGAETQRKSEPATSHWRVGIAWQRENRLSQHRMDIYDLQTRKTRNCNELLVQFPRDLTSQMYFLKTGTQPQPHACVMVPALKSSSYHPAPATASSADHEVECQLWDLVSTKQVHFALCIES